MFLIYSAPLRQNLFLWSTIGERKSCVQHVQQKESIPVVIFILFPEQQYGSSLPASWTSKSHIWAIYVSFPAMNAIPLLIGEAGVQLVIMKYDFYLLIAPSNKGYQAGQHSGNNLKDVSLLPCDKAIWRNFIWALCFWYIEWNVANGGILICPRDEKNSYAIITSQKKNWFSPLDELKNPCYNIKAVGA